MTGKTDQGATDQGDTDQGDTDQGATDQGDTDQGDTDHEVTLSRPVAAPRSDRLPTTLGVQVRGARATTDFAVQIADTAATVADVLQALELPDQTLVDGRRVVDPDAALAIDVLVGGSRFDPPGAPGPEPGAETGAVVEGAAVVEVAVVAGLDAGPVAQLVPGFYRLHGAADPTEGGWLLEIGSLNRPVVKAEPWHRCGALTEAITGDGFVVSIAHPVDAEAGAGRTIHRPPRVIPPESVAPIPVIDAPAAVSRPAPLSWSTLLAPIPIALMMAFFFRPIFALFAAMGPIMALGRWYESRRRFRRDTAEREAAVAAMVADVRAAIDEQRESLARLRWLSNPHVGELWRRARAGSVRLWERRPGTHGYLVVSVGIGPDAVSPVVDAGKLDAEVHEQMHKPIDLRSVPNTIDLAANTGLGLHGDRVETLAVARAIVLQLATLHGPSDLRLGVLADANSSDDWDWLKWLPHLDRDLAGHTANSIARSVAGPTPRETRPGNETVDTALATATRVLLVDSESADVASICRAARLADHELCIVAVGAEPTVLPAACSTLVAVEDGLAGSYEPASGHRRSLGAAIGVSAQTATDWARSLAAIDDPEEARGFVGEETDVSLLRLLGYTSPAALAEGWKSRSPDAAPTALVGIGIDGPFAIDLTRDGPHVLIAGTTGSGKSELLRTMVIALAATCPPEHVNFVLVDFKGGGAFDAVNRLPHVAGVITDLDEAMVTRALNSLRAELVRRETVFRALGVSTYHDAVLRSEEPIARLLIMIDEFAALATDHAELMAAIVDLAARGRSLGMHLVLATQRPSGVVDQKIRANTNLRIALRVQDAFDSQDVVGTTEAALIDRRCPGRAYVRVAGDRAVLVQTAYSAAIDTSSQRCTVRPHTLFGDEFAAAAHETAAQPTAGRPQPDATELEVLVDAVVAVNAGRPYSARPLWSEPLPASLDWIDLGSRELAECAAGVGENGGVALGLADVPERQSQSPWRWDPDSGSLAIYGASGACAGKLLVSVGAALASSAAADEVHLYVIDAGAGGVAALSELAHTGAYMTLDETDRIDRSVRLFEHALSQRRSARGRCSAPRLVMLIDNLAALVAAHDDLAAATLLDRLSALARDGSGHRLHLVIAGRTVRDISHRLAQQLPNRLVLALSDPSGYLALGLKAKDVVPLPAMRAIDPLTQRVVQLVEPPELASWSDDAIAASSAAQPIVGFPEAVPVTDLSPASLDGDELTIPIGIEAHDLRQTALVLRAGEHALVVGSIGLGCSTTLDTIVRQLNRASLGLRLVVVSSRRSPTVRAEFGGIVVSTASEIDSLGHGDSDGDVDGDRDRHVATVVIIDDVPRLASDVAAAVERLLDNVSVRIIAATTPEGARSIRSFTTAIRGGGTAIMLGGNPADGDLFRARLERVSGLGVIPGRGHLIRRGQAVPIQVAAATAPTENDWLL